MGKVKFTVVDPFGAASDPAMPQLAIALNRRRVAALLKRGLRSLLTGEQVLRICGIEVLRHKAGKRCVIQYDAFTEPPGNPAESFAILGKIRAHRAPATSYNLQQAFWRAGFDDAGEDGIAVAEPVAVLDELQMWFQRKAPGATATTLISPEASLNLPKRVAEAAVKIHRANVATEKKHGMADELRILKECFAAVTQQRPEFAARLENLFSNCERAAASLTNRPGVGIHRDFYADQILSNGDRLTILDFDLYCHGDPALDIGNFIGHLTEQALRLHHNSTALEKAESALRERFLEISGTEHARAVDVYTNLTLARHIFLSAKFPQRSHLTEPLLELCEARLRK
jgi:hypothetical protein